MSALGQKQTYAVQQSMSALPPIATAKAGSRKEHVRFTPENGGVRCATRDVRFGPKADIGLFDHFVGAAKKCGRECETEGLGSLEIYHCLIFCWRLYREVGRFFALENAVNVTRRAAVRID